MILAVHRHALTRFMKDSRHAVHVLIVEEKAFSQGPERARALAQGRDLGA